MMNDKELLKRSLENIEKQMDAIMQIFGGGRHLAGNAFDFNNLMITKQHIQDLLAVPEESNKDPVDFTKDSEYIKIVGKKSKKK